MSPHWTTILFDLDGTLIDSVPLVLASYRHSFAALGARDLDRLSDDELRAWIGVPLEETYEALAPDRAHNLIRHFREFNLSNHDDWVTAFQGATDLARCLAHSRERGESQCAVVTSKRRKLAQHGLDLTGLSAIPLLAAAEDSTLHKPHPEPLLVALEALGSTTDEAVYVGDAATDLRAARAAGIAAIGVLWGAGTRAELEAESPTLIAETFPDLVAALGIN